MEIGVLPGDSSKLALSSNGDNGNCTSSSSPSEYDTGVVESLWASGFTKLISCVACGNSPMVSNMEVHGSNDVAR